MKYYTLSQAVRDVERRKGLSVRQLDAGAAFEHDVRGKGLFRLLHERIPDEERERTIAEALEERLLAGAAFLHLAGDGRDARSVDLRRDAAFSLDKVGGLALRCGEYAVAVDAREKAAAIFLAAGAERDALFSRMHAVDAFSHLYLEGPVHGERQVLLNAQRRLQELSPLPVDAPRDLCVLHYEVGERLQCELLDDRALICAVEDELRHGTPLELCAAERSCRQGFAIARFGWLRHGIVQIARSVRSYSNAQLYEDAIRACRSALNTVGQQKKLHRVFIEEYHRLMARTSA